MTILLAGNPNAGKTTVFNALTGGTARVGNYPGVTVEKRTGTIKHASGEFQIVDLPGTYTLSARSKEESIAANALLQEDASLIVVVCDATSLRRSLYLASQVLEARVPTIVVLNMMDEAAELGIDIDEAVLAKELGCDVVPMCAKKGEGLDELIDLIAKRLGDAPAATEAFYQSRLAEVIASVEAVVRPDLADDKKSKARALSLWALLSTNDDDVEIPTTWLEAAVAARSNYEGDLDLELISGRYERVDSVAQAAVSKPKRQRVRTEKIDAVLLKPLTGLPIFIAVMFVIFQALFSWADPLMGLVETAIGYAQGFVVSVMPAGPLRDLIVEGMIAGVGNVVVFVPQIALLFFLLNILEDSGYLARVAFLLDKWMAGVGLHGKAFVPLLSGFACAIPAVMATRTIENRRDRLITMLALPLMSCSARLPVYVLVIATVFPVGATLGLGLRTGGVVLLCMYLLSVVATLGAAAVMRRTVLQGPRPRMVLTLPPYRRPMLMNLLRSTWRSVKAFLVDAGTVILAMTIVLWALLTYPKDENVIATFETQKAALVSEGLDEKVEALEAAHAATMLQRSAAGRVGKFVEPAFEPLGYDWRIVVGLFGAFAAREVFVSTLGMVFGIAEADEESVPLRQSLTEAKNSKGEALMTPLVGISLMVFFVFACQCMSTIAVVKRESGGWKWPTFMFVYMTLLAYSAAALVYQGGLLLGFT